MGTRVERVEDPTFLTAGGAYVADLRDPRLDGVAAVVFVRSTAAHARIVFSMLPTLRGMSDHASTRLSANPGNFGCRR